jgi:hypothetical protein
MDKSYRDDVYVCDATGPDNTDFLGDVNVKTLWPDGDSTTQFSITGNGSKSTHWEEVSELARLQTTDYVEDATTSNQDIFTMDNPGTSNAVKGLVVWATTNYNTTNKSHKFVITSNGTTQCSANVTNTTTTAFSSYVVEREPSANVAWNESTLNSMICGIEVV